MDKKMKEEAEKHKKHFFRFQLNYLILKIYFNLKLCKLNGLNKIGIIRQ